MSWTFKGVLLHLAHWFLVGFSLTLGFALARGLLSFAGWWR